MSRRFRRPVTQREERLFEDDRFLPDELFAEELRPEDFLPFDVDEPQGGVALDPHRPFAEVGLEVPHQARITRHAQLQFRWLPYLRASSSET